MKFELGKIRAQGVAYDARNNPDYYVWLLDMLRRHGDGDWGDMPEGDKKLNDESLHPETQGRVMSAYILPKQFQVDTGEKKIWIITEWDRSETNVIYPSEY